MAGETEVDKRKDISEVVELRAGLSPLQVEIVKAVIERFAGGFIGELCTTEFLSEADFEYFGTRLAAHHAYSSKMLKKENFEHALEQTFRRAGAKVDPQVGMTVRGADLGVGGVRLSLKTEGAAGLRRDVITISKLMEAAWIKQVRTREDIPDFIGKKVMPHFDNYERIFILRGYIDPDRPENIRYDLREIPKDLLQQIGRLTAEDFSDLTRTNTTRADVSVDGQRAFVFRLDGSDDKLTINHLDVERCPLHAWWSLAAPV